MGQISMGGSRRDSDTHNWDETGMPCVGALVQDGALQQQRRLHQLLDRCTYCGVDVCSAPAVACAVQICSRCHRHVLC